MTGSLLGLLLSLAVFPWAVECFRFPQLRQKSYHQKIWERKVDRDGVGGSERERKQESVRERGRERSVSPATGWLVERTDTDWHLSSTEAELKRASLLFVHYSLSLSLQPSLFLLFQLSCPLFLSAHPAAPMSCFFCLDGLCSSPVLAWGSNYTPPPCAGHTCTHKHTHTKAYTVAMRRPRAQTQVRLGSVKGRKDRKPDRSKPRTEADLRAAGWTQ